MLPTIIRFSAIALLVIAFFAWYLAPQARSITVEALTQSIEIELVELRSEWLLPDSTLCLADTTDLTVAERRRRARTASGDCGSSESAVPVSAGSVLVWPAGTRVVITRGGTRAPVRVTMSMPADREARLGDTVLESNATLVLDSREWAMQGVLRFDGKVRIGALPAPGSIDHLTEGRYELRDSLRGRAHTTVTRRGELLLGDRISIVSGPERDAPEVISTGLAVARPAEEGFGVVVHGGGRTAGLLVQRIGSEPSFFASDWIDRAREDSRLLAVSAALTLIATVMSMLSIIVPAWRRMRSTEVRNDAPSDQGGSDEASTRPRSALRPPDDFV